MEIDPPATASSINFTKIAEMPSAQDMKHFGIGILYGVAAVSIGFYICLDSTHRSSQANWTLQRSVHECDHTIAEAIESTFFLSLPPHRSRC